MSDFWLPVLVGEGDTLKVDTADEGFYEFTVVDVSDGEVTVEHRRDREGERQQAELSLLPRLVNDKKIVNVSIRSPGYRMNDRNL